MNLHSQASVAGKTLRWFGSDDQQNYHQNLMHKSQDLEAHGWIHSEQKILYKFNSHGFRDIEFDDRPAGLALGCSHTMGVGIQEQHTWPRQLAKKLAMHVWNLGIGGASLDCCFRVIDHYIEVLEPKFVILQIPSSSRYEIYQGRWVTISAANTDIPSDLAGFFKYWFAYDENYTTQTKRNTLAIRQRCQEKSIPLLIAQPKLPSDGTARDLMHPGLQAHTTFTDYLYSEKHQYLPE